MSDLAGALARTRKPQSQLPWVESAGGPLIVMPSSALAKWRGAPVDFDPSDLDTWGDYGRACQIDGYAGTLDAGDDQALVLGDEPASTTYLPEQWLIVRWIYADSEADVIRLIPNAVETANWEDTGTWTTGGPGKLFDSALAGDKLEHEHHLRVDVAPGTYQVRTAYVEPDDQTALVLVHLVPALGVE
jgi:hypothetical protein